MHYIEVLEDAGYELLSEVDNISLFSNETEYIVVDATAHELGNTMTEHMPYSAIEVNRDKSNDENLYLTVTIPEDTPANVYMARDNFTAASDENNSYFDIRLHVEENPEKLNKIDVKHEKSTGFSTSLKLYGSPGDTIYVKVPMTLTKEDRALLCKQLDEKSDDVLEPFKVFLEKSTQMKRLKEYEENKEKARNLFPEEMWDYVDDNEYAQFIKESKARVASITGKKSEASIVHFDKLTGKTNYVECFSVQDSDGNNYFLRTSPAHSNIMALTSLKTMVDKKISRERSDTIVNALKLTGHDLGQSSLVEIALNGYRNNAKYPVTYDNMSPGDMIGNFKNNETLIEIIEVEDVDPNMGNPVLYGSKHRVAYTAAEEKLTGFHLEDDPGFIVLAGNNTFVLFDEGIKEVVDTVENKIKGNEQTSTEDITNIFVEALCYERELLPLYI